jgi:hypothetical protein
MSTNEVLDNLFNACDPLLKATGEYYVDSSLARGGNAFTRDVLRKLDRTRPGSWLRILFSGHVGGGKSSELEHLRSCLERHESSVRRFFPVFLDVIDYLNVLDVTSADILLSIVAEVAATLKEKAGIELKDSYFLTRFKEVRSILFSDVELGKINVPIPLSGAKADITLIKQASAAVREQVREMLNPQMPTLLSEINIIFDEARLALKRLQPAAGASSFTDIVLILDNMERIQRVGGREEGEESWRHLFLGYAPQLTGLNAHVIYTVPLTLVRSHGPQLMDVYGVDPFVLPMIKVEERGTHRPYPQGRACLKEILRKRAGVTSLDEVFTHQALDWMITYCGGYVRHLMQFVRQACTEVDGPPIDIKAARKSLNGVTALFATSITPDQWTKLARLERSTDQKIDNHDPDCRQMLEMLSAFEYINGGVESDHFSSAEPWYAVNPIVRQLTQFKAAVEALDREKTP